MSGKTKKLMNQEIREDYGDEATEGTASIFQGDDEFNGADGEFEEECAEENEFDAARAEERAARERSQRAGNLDGYAMGTADDPKEDEGAAGNREQLARNPVRGIHSW